MPIISVGDKENNRWKRNGEKKQTNKDRKGQGDGGWGGGGAGSRSYSEKVRAKWFWCAFNLGFLQLICKDSLSFSVSFTNFFEAKRIIWAKACCCGLQLLQNMRLVILFDMFLNPSFKMATSFGNIARTPGSTSKFIC